MIRWCRRRSCVGCRTIMCWSSVELVKGMCSPGFLRLHSPDDPVWVQRMRRSVRPAYAGELQVTLEKGGDNSSDDLTMASDGLGRPIGPSGGWGPLQRLVEKV